VLVQVTANAPLVRAKLVRVNGNRDSDSYSHSCLCERSLCLSVTAGYGDVVVIHCVEEELERRPFVWNLPPAHEHDVVHLPGTVGRLRVSEAFVQLVLHLLVAHLCTRTHTPCADMSATVRPSVRTRSLHCAWCTVGV